MDADPVDGRLAFHAIDLRKTYGVKKIPSKPFGDCRLNLRSNGSDWREQCGKHDVCRNECTKCWTLNVKELRIPQGRTTSILGHSGSGKTTLLNLLALLDRPDRDSGRLELNFNWPAEGPSQADCLGKSPQVSMRHKTSYNQMRRRLFGFVFQSGHLNSNLNAYWNLALAQGLSGAGLDDMRTRAEGLFEDIGFPRHRRRALPRHLSGGEYQRVAVARALANNPQVVFADEPTGNLDPENGARVICLLQKWRSENEHNTLILVTHNPEQAFECSDHIVVLAGGEVALSGPKDQLNLDQIRLALKNGAPAECACA